MPWSAHFFAELAGFKDVVKEFRDSKLHDFELDRPRQCLSDIFFSSVT